MTPPAQPVQMLRLHIGEDDRYQGRRLFEEIVDRCRSAGMVLVSVCRGIEGFGASSIVHRPGLFGRSKDAPIVITVVDTPEKIAALLPVLNGVVDEGLIAISGAECIRFGASSGSA